MGARSAAVHRRPRLSHRAAPPRSGVPGGPAGLADKQDFDATLGRGALESSGLCTQAQIRASARPPRDPSVPPRPAPDPGSSSRSTACTCCPASAARTGRCRPRPRPAPRYWPGPGTRGGRFAPAAQMTYGPPSRNPSDAASSRRRRALGRRGTDELSSQLKALAEGGHGACRDRLCRPAGRSR